MELNKIKQIINSGSPDDYKEQQIINILASDESVIPLIMRILEAERVRKEKLISDFNFHLSRALIGLDDSKYNQNHMMNNGIIEFFLKYKDIRGVGSLFKDISNIVIPKKDDLPFED